MGSNRTRRRRRREVREQCMWEVTEQEGEGGKGEEEKYENSLCGKYQIKEEKNSTRTVYVGSNRRGERRIEVREQSL